MKSKLEKHTLVIWTAYQTGRFSISEIEDMLVRFHGVKTSLRNRLEIGRVIQTMRLGVAQRIRPIGAVRYHLDMPLKQAVQEEWLVFPRFIERMILRRIEQVVEGNWESPYTVKEFAMIACSQRLRFDGWGFRIPSIRAIQEELMRHGLIELNPARAGHKPHCRFPRCVPTFPYTKQEYYDAG